MNEYYKNAIQSGRNLTQESVDFEPALFRDEVVTKIIDMLARKKSVLLVGTSGVGKTRIIHEAVSKMRQSGRAKVFEFSVTQLLAGTKYLGEWESKVDQILKSAVKSASFLYFSDIWNLPTIGKSSNSDNTAWDAIRPYVDRGKLQIIGEVTPEQLQNLSRVADFASMFETIEIPALNPAQIKTILEGEANRLKLDPDNETITRIIDLCHQFQAESQGPGPMLELLSQIKDYQAQKQSNNQPEPLSPAFAEKVFSIYSGLPPIVVSPSVTCSVKEITEWFEQRVVGQPAAIQAVVETIALYKAGLQDPDRPIGSFLFVGPTGVGKTELARALAKFLFGTENRLLRFDLSEFKDYQAYQQLIGDPSRPSQPARLIDPVRAKPFQVILLDEIEKAHANIWDLLLQLLDEGRLSPTMGKTTNFRNTIIIATSNVGALESAKSGIGFVSGSPDASSEKMHKALEATFRPELINRFQHVVQFYPLGKDQIRKIARMELAKVIARQGISNRQIIVDVTEPVLNLIVDQGYNEKYGARALRRMVQRHVSLPIATCLLEKTVVDGCILKLSRLVDNVKVDIIDTPVSRESKNESRPIPTKYGKLKSRADLEERFESLREQKKTLTQKIDTKRMLQDTEDTDALIQHGKQSLSPEALAWKFNQREAVLLTTQRLEQIQQRETEIEQWMAGVVSRAECLRLADELYSYELELHAANRELLMMQGNSLADAIVELSPIGTNNQVAIELFQIYQNWAKRRGISTHIIYESTSNTGSIVAALSGHYAFGYLRLESGHHRFREDRQHTVIKVRVLPWLEPNEKVRFGKQRALKKIGIMGGRIRSRVEITGTDVVIQNDRNVVENRNLAASIAPALIAEHQTTDHVVRRYDKTPFLLRDYLTGFSSGRQDTLKPEKFHNLLCRRVELEYQEPAN